MADRSVNTSRPRLCGKPCAAVVWLVLWSLSLAFPVAADEPVPADNPDAATQDATRAANAEPAEKESLLDRHKRGVDSRVHRVAQWVDSFFQDPNYEAEVATSQLRVRPEIYYRNEQGAKYRVKTSLKVRLPNVDRKISFIMGNAADDASPGNSVDDRAEDSVVGLQFFGKLRERLHLSLSAGFKSHEFAAYLGPRVRYRKPLGERSSLHFTQTIRWQTNHHWQFRSRLDFNHATSDSLLFRQTFDGRWRAEKSDDEGYRTRVSSLLTQRVSESSGMQYDFTTIMHTRPDTHVDIYRLATRYRKRSSRDWLYYEIAPQVSFEHEFDYKANPGIRLRLEFFYGSNQDRSWRRRPGDGENFRW